MTDLYYAFPSDLDAGHYPGMTMEDFFAAHAMSGSLAMMTPERMVEVSKAREDWKAVLAKTSYEIAEEMVKASKKHRGWE